MASKIKDTYVGDGTTVLYSFTFPYISIQDINVSVDGTPLSLPSEYTLANATTIQFATAPADGSEIVIFRSTDGSDLKAVFYPGSSIRAKDLNDNFTQTLYVTQEATGNLKEVEDFLADAAQEVRDSQAEQDWYLYQIKEYIELSGHTFDPYPDD